MKFGCKCMQINMCIYVHTIKDTYAMSMAPGVGTHHYSNKARSDGGSPGRPWMALLQGSKILKDGSSCILHIFVVNICIFRENIVIIYICVCAVYCYHYIILIIYKFTFIYIYVECLFSGAIT